MRRVLIFGSGGAGKSELARSIGRQTGLPVVHLDTLFWAPGWNEAPREQALQQVEAAARADRWVIDGNFLGDADGRLRRADTIVFLDLPRLLCLYRVTKRLLRDRGRRRADLPAGCEESFDPAGLRWIWSYPRTDRPRVLDLLHDLDKTAGAVTVHHLRSRAQVRDFVDRLSARPHGG